MCNKKLLVLDLDETLIHATEIKKEGIEADFSYKKYWIYIRPGLIQFLNEISSYYEIAIWSSAEDEYVKYIVNHVIPKELALAFIWTRTKCTYKLNKVFDTYYYEKRLEKLKKLGYQLEKIIIVDDSPEKSKNNYGNAIYIKPNTAQDNDTELYKLDIYLKSIYHVENFRDLEKRYWDK